MQLKKWYQNELSPLLIPIVGSGTQVLLWIFIFMVTSYDVANPYVGPILDLFILIGIGFEFFLPFLSLIGLFLSVRNLVKKQHPLLNSVAFVLNLLWLALIVLFLYVIIILGPSV